MAEDADTLRKAMDRILGYPGTPVSKTAGTQNIVQLETPKTPQSAVANTTSDIAQTGGEVFDPFADVNAELDALKQRNVDLARSLGISTPVHLTPGAAVGSGGEQMHSDYLGYYNQNYWNEPGSDLASPQVGQVEGGAVQGLFYNPTGKKGGFQSLTAEALADPTVYANVKGMSTVSGGRDPVGDKIWADWLAKGKPPAPVVVAPAPKPTPITSVSPAPGPPGKTIYPVP
jgi:hypothetical protein